METKKEMIYPVQPWDITETAFCQENNYRNETTFALSNGYIGTRGTFEEGYDFSIDEGLEGNFINGFYESEDIRYGEWNFGFPVRSQSLLNLPDGKRTRIYLDDELFDMRTGRTEEYCRVLHMKEGVVERRLTWTSPGGRKAVVHFERLVSFTHKNVMAQRVEIQPLEGIKQITVQSCLNGNVENHTRKTNPLVDYGPFGRRIQAVCCEDNEGCLYFQGKTLKSGLSVACGAAHDTHTVCSYSGSVSEYYAQGDYVFPAESGQTIVFDKYIVYTSSLDMPEEELKEFVHREEEKCIELGYKNLRREQTEYMDDFWKYADVQIQGDDALQQGIRFNLFHIMQSAGRDGRTGMGAKGLSGEGYEGHYFWDTEMYVLPFFIYTAPEIARKLLEYRHHTLDKARDRARDLGHMKGALYPWRTINGEEASTYFPLGTAQYHINADIAYAFQLYVNVTGDMDFFRDMAAEVLCETARVWADVGSFARCRGDRYCICAVTGPDEYNAIVDNNFYTNLMARENIRDALNALKRLKEMDIKIWKEFVERLQITEEETDYWQRIVDHMYFPYDEERRVYPLDDGFMMRKPWDDSKIPPEKRHLLYENYHPLFVYRQRMSKQADAILGMYLHSNLFTEEELKRNYDFYQEVTLHHSSLSTCIFGILACEIGYYDEAYEYFSQSARMDLDDYHNNFYAGIHAANMAGTWQAIVNGFAGLRTNGGRLELKPYLPEKWDGYSFLLRYQGNVIKTVISKGMAEFSLLEGKGLSIWIQGKEICLTEKENTYAEKI
ncbi:MAG: glycosyl hydrolase family 65 protein [Eubacteriales bacterium]|nr:glycosyl hydrolase family 65 protein [Eubacteriales bacterium]